MVDASPGFNADTTFGRNLRRTDRSLDLGPAAFRFSTNTAERLLAAQLSPFNEFPVQGINKYKETKQKYYMPETVKWYMKAAENNTHHIDLGPKSKWEKNLPFLRDPKLILGHYHKRTHFKSAHALNFLNANKIDLDDIHVTEMMKNMQVSSNKTNKRLDGQTLATLLDGYQPARQSTQLKEVPSPKSPKHSNQKNTFKSSDNFSKSFGKLSKALDDSDS